MIRTEVAEIDVGNRGSLANVGASHVASFPTAQDWITVTVDGKILEASNHGGVDWYSFPIGGLQPNVNVIKFSTSKDGIAITENGLLLESTSDGGFHWTHILAVST